MFSNLISTRPDHPSGSVPKLIDSEVFGMPRNSNVFQDRSHARDGVMRTEVVWWNKTRKALDTGRRGSYTAQNRRSGSIRAESKWEMSVNNQVRENNIPLSGSSHLHNQVTR